MIVDLPNTTTAEVSKKLVRLRDDVGAMALSRVLTLVVAVDETDVEAAVETANLASHQHPCRIVVVAAGNRRGTARLDAQIRVGGDAGASEVVVMRLYGALTGHGRSVVTPLLLADSPIVAWWPTWVPPDPSKDPIGEMASRRITDLAASTSKPKPALRRLAASYTPGDTDLAWTRITLWRGLLAAALDQAPYEPVTAVTVTGAPDSASVDLLGAWLGGRLRCPVTLARSRSGTGLIGVRLVRRSGDVDLVRPPDGNVATLSQVGQPERTLSLPHRSDAECLADELRRLDPDEVYADALVRGMQRVTQPRTLTASKAVARGDAPSPKEAEQDIKRLHRAAARVSRAAMESRPEPAAPPSDPDEVKAETRRRLAPDGATTTSSRRRRKGPS
ncbi:glucose-6-phosphate dehydrogenase assembly protein OpcA [Nostocoides japonicum]|uniref:glucose-6-phosphate dehydrogenase assembly protein OpcA n=1 Tax=Nostocoides japonicum TaxID=99481 RepID=UPI00065BAE00|nr:glucose-6-phosphate dehydrogenase assembly protein OpcA [Tetrasphaera japonica]